MTDSIKLPVEIEYHFRWENPCFKQKIEIFACDEHVATVDKIGTLHLNSHVPCQIEATRAARVWAGWEKATTDSQLPSTDSRHPTADDPWKYPEGYDRPPTAERRLPPGCHQDVVKLVERYHQCVLKLLDKELEWLCTLASEVCHLKSEVRNLNSSSRESAVGSVGGRS